MTTVVNINKGQPYTVYIGRYNVEHNLPESPFHNPFHTHIRGYEVTSRLDNIRRFREYLKANPELVNRIRVELRGQILGCYCKPKPCHGDILARVADGGEV